jgi:hypothetical protein
MADTFEYSGDHEWALWRTGVMCAVCEMYDSTKTEAIGVSVASYAPFYTSPHPAIEVTPVCEKCATEHTNHPLNNWTREINIIRFVKEDN